MTTADVRITQIIDRCAAAVTDANGRLRKRDLVGAVRREFSRDDLPASVLAAVRDKAAMDAVTKYGEQRNPRRRRNGTLFDPDDWLKLGNGIWVRMRRATDSDLVAWSKLSSRNRARVDEADDELQEYANSRIAAFRNHTGVLALIDLERGAFGWSEEDADYPNGP